jgi:tetratricopeptide (TPR) repeat protein
MDALKSAVKDKRYSLARVSGGFDHSPHAETLRGDDDGGDSLLFDRAEIKTKAAAQDRSDSRAGLISARLHLIRGTSNEANKALLILEQLSKDGVETPEALNDLGVAQFQRFNYDEAVAYFTKALAKSPGYGEALFNRALSYERLDRDDEARGDWQQFISQSPSDGWKAEAMTHLRDLNKPGDR